ncbi:MAG: Co2+/Mg2+ efflux protein ApaG [Flavobacteriales bacterium]|nr:Co2+/Mg2+ efflux protein ApaG [Flavobacteriales bacterium]
MITEVTEGIRISVDTSYQPSHSKPAESVFWFSYKIIIENCGSQQVRLLRRHWYIYETNGQIREVEGKGVVGEQPRLDPGETHEYTSACDLSTEIGKMHGTYLMERTGLGERFYVNIPEFTMAVPHVLN